VILLDEIKKHIQIRLIFCYRFWMKVDWLTIKDVADFKTPL
jgi:hypothetical protein